MAPDLGWLHRYVPAEADAADARGTVPNRGTNAGPLTLLLLHGTGGDENSLVGLGRLVAPKANLLSVRGRSNEEGVTRFFRRFSATSYDQAHLVSEAKALGRFARLAADTYGFDRRGLVACGYSNGANIALATLAYDADAFAAAILLRAVMPLDEPPEVDLGGKPVLVLHGVRDAYAPYARDLAPYLTHANARVSEISVAAGHELVEEDVAQVRAWLEAFVGEVPNRANT